MGGKEEGGREGERREGGRKEREGKRDRGRTIQTCIPPYIIIIPGTHV